MGLCPIPRRRTKDRHGALPHTPEKGEKWTWGSAPYPGRECDSLHPNEKNMLKHVLLFLWCEVYLYSQKKKKFIIIINISIIGITRYIFLLSAMHQGRLFPSSSSSFFFKFLFLPLNLIFFKNTNFYYIWISYSEIHEIHPALAVDLSMACAFLLLSCPSAAKRRRPLLPVYR